jgi:ATP-dependent DNA ligase
MLQRSRRTVGLIEPCLPSPAKAAPSGSDWLHEIKHDGFRILAQRAVQACSEPCTPSYFL